MHGTLPRVAVGCSRRTAHCSTFEPIFDVVPTKLAAVVLGRTLGKGQRGLVIRAMVRRGRAECCLGGHKPPCIPVHVGHPSVTGRYINVDDVGVARQLGAFTDGSLKAGSVHGYGWLVARDWRYSELLSPQIRVYISPLTLEADAS